MSKKQGMSHVRPHRVPKRRERDEDDDEDETPGVDDLIRTGSARKLGFARAGGHDEADIDVRKQPWKQEDA